MTSPQEIDSGIDDDSIQEGEIATLKNFPPNILKNKLLLTPFEFVVKKKKNKIKDTKITSNRITMKNQNITNKEVEKRKKIILTRMRIHGWKTIQSFTVNIPKCISVTEKSIGALLSGIGNQFPRIELLHLSLNTSSNRAHISNKINNKSLDLITAKIADSFVNLKQLMLDFCGNQNITDQGIIALGFNIARDLMNLKKLKLNFTRCKKITNKGVSQLGDTIGRRLIYLNELSISFFKCPLVSDAGVSRFGLKVKKYLGKLNYVGLILGGTKVTSQCVRTLGFGICKNLRGLRTLALSFAKIQDIKLEDFETLVKEICQNFENLQEIYLHFDNCQLIKMEDLIAARSEFKKRFSQLQTLHIQR